jgi:hypothetical protein
MAADTAGPPAVLIMPMGDYREAYLATVIQPIRERTADHIHLTKEDVTRSLERERAGRKSILMSAFFSADVNRDNVLDGSELSRTPLNYQIKTQDMAAADENHDGKISLEEWLAFAETAALTITPRRDAGSLSGLLALDPDGDGQLSADELLRLASAAFGYYDKNNDGVLSPAEKAVLNSDRATLFDRDTFQARMRECEMPEVGQDQKLYVISAYEGGTLSNVALAGQDNSTETATIGIGKCTEAPRVESSLS